MRTVPDNLKPPANGHIFDDCRSLAATDPLIWAAQTKSDPEITNPRIRSASAFQYQGHFLARGARRIHHHQFYPVADGANRADKVMTNTRADKRGKIRSIVHFGHPSTGPDSTDQESTDLQRKGANMAALLEPGMMVRHPQRPDWGLGQVQSSIGNRVTVNFEHAGKVVIDLSQVELTPDFSPRDSH